MGSRWRTLRSTCLWAIKRGIRYRRWSVKIWFEPRLAGKRKFPEAGAVFQYRLGRPVQVKYRAGGLFCKCATKWLLKFSKNDDCRKNVKKYLKKYFISCILSTWNSSTHCGTLKIGKYGTVPYSEKSLHQIRGSSHDTQGNGARWVEMTCIARKRPKYGL